MHRAARLSCKDLPFVIDHAVFGILGHDAPTQGMHAHEGMSGQVAPKRIRHIRAAECPGRFRESSTGLLKNRLVADTWPVDSHLIVLVEHHTAIRVVMGPDEIGLRSQYRA